MECDHFELNLTQSLEVLECTAYCHMNILGGFAIMTTAGNDARLNFRLSSDLKQIIERAAAHTGQTVSDFAVSTLVQNARRVIEEHDRTELSRRDRDVFVNLLDDSKANPNRALAAAARKYKRQRS